jgi:hypothetical protein
VNDSVPLNEPPALASEYHKARRQLMLWSGILFVWEFIGVDLEKAATAGGNVGAFVSSIKSPQAIPWVILILVGYFMFRLTVEWLQSSPLRRMQKVAQLDFVSCLSVAVVANLLYFYQQLAQVQFANIIHGSTLVAAFGGLWIGVFLISSFVASYGAYEGGVKRIVWCTGVVVFAIIGIWIVWPAKTYPFVIGLSFSGIVYALRGALSRRV